MITLTQLNTVLIIINSIIIIFMLTHHVRFGLIYSWGRQTLVGIQIYFKHKGFLYIPIRNQHRTQVRNDIKNWSKHSDQSRHQVLYATFSWLKTIKQVKQFEKDYSKVDKEFVSKLVEEFYLKLEEKNYTETL